MGGDQGEGEVAGTPAPHPHLTSPITGEGPLGTLQRSYRDLKIYELVLFLALQLLVRISLQLSSPGRKSKPQKCGDGPLGEE